MKQFDIYVNTDEDLKEAYPYFVDIQTDLLCDLNSRVVLPIIPTVDAKKYPSNLCPVIDISAKKYALLTHQVTTVPVSFLKEKVGSILFNRDEIVSSIDFLITGI